MNLELEMLVLPENDPENLEADQCLDMQGRTIALEEGVRVKDASSRRPEQFRTRPSTSAKPSDESSSWCFESSTNANPTGNTDTSSGECCKSARAADLNRSRNSIRPA